MGITSPTGSSSTWRDRYKVFMEGGSCKESYRASKYSLEETHRVALLKCMETRSDYYQPVCAANKKALEHLDATWSSFLDQIKEVDSKIEDERERSLAFMKGGGCKELFTTWYDNCNEDDSDKNKDDDHVNKCGRLAATMARCSKDHSDYYQPFLSVIESTDDKFKTELKALFF